MEIVSSTNAPILIKLEDAEGSSVDAAVTSNDTAISSPIQTLYDALVASNATLQASYDALVNPVSTALTTSADVINGTAGNDAITGSSTTYTAGDVIVDSSATDSDTLTVTATDDITAAVTIAGIESVNFNLDAISATGMGGGAGGTAGFDVNVEGISNGTVTAAVTKAASPITAVKFTNVGDGLTVASAHSITAAADANANITINATGAAAQTITAVTGTLDDLTIVGSGTGLLTVTDADAEEIDDFEE